MSNISTTSSSLNGTITPWEPMPQITLTDFTQVKIAKFLDLWVEAAILFGGVIANSLLLTVLSIGKHYHSISMYLYLKVLAVIDTCSLSITLTTHWVNYNFLPGNKNLYLCKTILFTATECLDLGACIFAAMATDRLIAVVRPLNHKTICTIKNTVLGLFALGFVTIGKNAYTFYKAGFALNGKNKQCAPQYDGSVLLDHFFPWIDLLVGSIIPFALIMVCNIAIIITVKKPRIMPSHLNKKKEKKRERQLTILLLLVTTTFLMCTLPRKVFTVVLTYLPPARGMQQIADYMLGHSITAKLWHLNSAINIWLCIVSGSRFRLDLVLLFTRLFRKNVVAPTTNSTNTNTQDNQVSKF